MARLFMLLGALVVGALVFFPHEVEMALIQAKLMIQQLAVGAAGYYGTR
jgi:hypothetical protein